MFGGLAFMAKGHMFVGILGKTLMARVGPERYDQELSLPHVRAMDFTGRPMKGYVFVVPRARVGDSAFSASIAACIGFVRTLPAKKSKTASRC
jgi:TfoX N-terminal domain